MLSLLRFQICLLQRTADKSGETVRLRVRLRWYHRLYYLGTCSLVLRFTIMAVLILYKDKYGQVSSLEHYLRHDLVLQVAYGIGIRDFYLALTFAGMLTFCSSMHWLLHHWIPLAMVRHKTDIATRLTETVVKPAERFALAIDRHFAPSDTKLNSLTSLVNTFVRRPLWSMLELWRGGETCFRKLSHSRKTFFPHFGPVRQGRLLLMLSVLRNQQVILATFQTAMFLLWSVTMFPPLLVQALKDDSNLVFTLIKLILYLTDLFISCLLPMISDSVDFLLWAQLVTALVWPLTVECTHHNQVLYKAMITGRLGGGGGGGKGSLNHLISDWFHRLARPVVALDRSLVRHMMLIALLGITPNNAYSWLYSLLRRRTTSESSQATRPSSSNSLQSELLLFALIEVALMAINTGWFIRLNSRLYGGNGHFRACFIKWQRNPATTPTTITTNFTDRWKTFNHLEAIERRCRRPLVLTVALMGSLNNKALVEFLLLYGALLMSLASNSMH